MQQPLLGGLRVLDMTQIRAGPKAARWVADAGAEVIKVEARGRSDGRGFGRRGSGNAQSGPDAPMPEEEQRERNRVSFEQLHRNKQGHALGLSYPRGIEIFKQMVGVCDVVMENFSFGVMEWFGLGYNELRKHRLDLVMVSMPAYGATGSYRDYVSFGWARKSTWPGSPPGPDTLEALPRKRGRLGRSIERRPCRHRHHDSIGRPA